MPTIARLFLGLCLMICVSVVIPPTAAQDSADSQPILWMSERLPDNNFQIYTWDGEQAVNVSQYPGYCTTLYPTVIDQWLYRCNGDLFSWDGQRSQLISNEGYILRPSYAEDGRLAWWAGDHSADFDLEVAVWDGETVRYVSGDYGWRGSAYWAADGGEESPRWSNDGRLAWYSTQDNEAAFGIYVWDGERVITVADGLQWVNQIEWLPEGLLWSTSDQQNSTTNPLVRHQFLWNGEQNIMLGDYAQLGETVSDGNGRLAWLAHTSEAQIQDVFVWDGVQILTVSDHSAVTNTSLRWLEDGRLIWWSNPQEDGQVEVWDGSSTQNITSEIGAVRAMRWLDAQNGYLFTAERDGETTVYFWDMTQFINISSMLPSVEQASWTRSGGVEIRVGILPNQSIWYWDGSTTTLISDMPGIAPSGSIWDTTGAVVFQVNSETQASQIYLWEKGSLTLMLEGVSLEWAERRGNLLFIQAGTADMNSEVFLWDGTTITNISQNPRYDGFYYPYGMG